MFRQDEILARLDAQAKIIQRVEAALTKGLTVGEDTHTWVQLLADTQADRVQEEFLKLVDAFHKDGSKKLSNVALGEMVHQAVLNARTD